MSLIPFDFAFLSSRDKKNRFEGNTKDFDKRSCGYKRRFEAPEKATNLIKPMIRRILSYQIKSDYILMDSWFCWPKVVCALDQYAPVIEILSHALIGVGDIDAKLVFVRNRHKQD